MTGLERNSDVVKLASYAPLLANERLRAVDAGRDLVRQRRVLGLGQLLRAEAVREQRRRPGGPSTLAPSAEPRCRDLTGGVFLSTWATRRPTTTSRSRTTTAARCCSTTRSRTRRSGRPRPARGRRRTASTCQSAPRSPTRARSSRTRTPRTGRTTRSSSTPARSPAPRASSSASPPAARTTSSGGTSAAGTTPAGAAEGRGRQRRRGQGDRELVGIVTGPTYQVKVVVEGRTSSCTSTASSRWTYDDELPTTERLPGRHARPEHGRHVVKVVNIADRWRCARR